MVEYQALVSFKKQPIIVAVPTSLKKKKNETLEDISIVKEDKKVVTINLDHNR